VSTSSGAMEGASTGAAPNKIQFNGAGGYWTYISSRCCGVSISLIVTYPHAKRETYTAIGWMSSRRDNTNRRDRQMRAKRKDRHGDLIPVIAACLALMGQTIILCSDFGGGKELQGNDSARMITDAAVSRAGAIEIPSTPHPL
jgi:hypothetical protein